MVPCIGTSTLPEPTGGGTAAAGRPRRLLGGLGRRRGGDRRVGHPHLDVEALAVDLDRRGALDQRSASSSAAAGGFGAAMPRQVERLLDPLRRVLHRREVGVAQDREVGRDRRGDAFDDHLLEGPDGAGDRGRPVLAPHDQLADEVVVVLADRVAGLVAGVEAHAEPVGCDQLGDRARATAGTCRRPGSRR